MKKYAMISMGMAACSLLFFFVHLIFLNFLDRKLDYDSPVHMIGGCCRFFEHLLLIGSVLVLGLGHILTAKQTETTVPPAPPPPAS